MRYIPCILHIKGTGARWATFDCELTFYALQRSGILVTIWTSLKIRTFSYKCQTSGATFEKGTKGLVLFFEIAAQGLTAARPRKLTPLPWAPVDLNDTSWKPTGFVFNLNFWSPWKYQRNTFLVTLFAALFWFCVSFRDVPNRSTPFHEQTFVVKVLCFFFALMCLLLLFGELSAQTKPVCSFTSQEHPERQTQWPTASE